MTIPKDSSSLPMPLGGSVRPSLVPLQTKRVPSDSVHMVETINKLVREQRNLLQELGQDPTPEQIAERMDMTPDRCVKS